MPTDDRESTPFDDGDLYDLLFEKLEYGIDFYLALAREANGPVLDIACGTGRIMLPCLRLGLDVDGVDLFPAMLARLQKKAEAENFRPRLYHADMATFKTDRQYRLIMIPFNAFVHNLTTSAQIACLRRCYEHLLPGGILAFDTFFPGSALVTTPNGKRDLELEIKDPATEETLRLFDTRSFDRVEQRQYSQMEIERVNAHGKIVSVRRSSTIIRWIYKFEMELLLQAAGFERWQILGEFGDRPLLNETDAMVVKAWGATQP